MYLYPVFHYGVLGYTSYLSIYCLYSYSTTNIMLNCLFIDVIFCKYCTTWSLYDFKLLLIYIIYNLIGWSLKVVSLLNPEMLNCWWHAFGLFLNPLFCLWSEHCCICIDIQDWKGNCFCFFNFTLELILMDPYPRSQKLVYRVTVSYTLKAYIQSNASLMLLVVWVSFCELNTKLRNWWIHV